MSSIYLHLGAFVEYEFPTAHFPHNSYYDVVFLPMNPYPNMMHLVNDPDDLRNHWRKTRFKVMIKRDVIAEKLHFNKHGTLPEQPVYSRFFAVQNERLLEHDEIQQCLYLLDKLGYNQNERFSIYLEKGIDDAIHNH